MPSIYQPRRPRASPLWQILTAAWDTFLTRYEKFHRPALGHSAPTSSPPSATFSAAAISPPASSASTAPTAVTNASSPSPASAATSAPPAINAAISSTSYSKPPPKITWNPTTQTVIYRSKRHHSTKRKFEIFKAPDFIAAALLHLPPKGQQTVRYYGTDSDKTRAQTPLILDRIIRVSAFHWFTQHSKKSPIRGRKSWQGRVARSPAPQLWNGGDACRVKTIAQIMQVEMGDKAKAPCHFDPAST